jgi:hypothetical protein
LSTHQTMIHWQSQLQRQTKQLQHIQGIESSLHMSSHIAIMYHRWDRNSHIQSKSMIVWQVMTQKRWNISRKAMWGQQWWTKKESHKIAEALILIRMLNMSVVDIEQKKMIQFIQHFTDEWMWSWYTQYFQDGWQSKVISDTTDCLCSMTDVKWMHVVCRHKLACAWLLPKTGLRRSEDIGGGSSEKVKCSSKGCLRGYSTAAIVKTQSRLDFSFICGMMDNLVKSRVLISKAAKIVWTKWKWEENTLAPCSDRDVHRNNILMSRIMKLSVNAFWTIVALQAPGFSHHNHSFKCISTLTVLWEAYGDAICCSDQSFDFFEHSRPSAAGKSHNTLSVENTRWLLQWPLFVIFVLTRTTWSVFWILQWLAIQRPTNAMSAMCVLSVWGNVNRFYFIHLNNILKHEFWILFHFLTVVFNWQVRTLGGFLYTPIRAWRYRLSILVVFLQWCCWLILHLSLPLQ